MIKIIADSTCDLSPQLIQKYNIDIIPLYVHMGEEEYRDGVDITPKEIYQWSDANKTTPKTAAFSLEDAINIMEPYVKEGDDIIAFAISEDMSTSANVIRLAADELEVTEKVHVIDSQNLSTGIGHLIIETAIMIEQGMEIEEILYQIKTLIPLVKSSFVVDTLTYLHRGGRCSSTAALFGNALRLKPRIVVNEGKMLADHKYRGKQDKVILQYVKEMEKELLNAKQDRVFITHSGCVDEIIDNVYDYIKGLNYFKEIYITTAGSVISSHCGPGTLGVLYMQKKKAYGPYDEEFDFNRNGVMEEDEKAAEAAYIRHMAEQESEEDDAEEDVSDYNE